MDRFSKMMDVWILPSLLRRRRKRMSMVKTNKGQAEQGCSLVGSDPMVTSKVGTHAQMLLLPKTGPNADSQKKQVRKAQ